MQTIYKRSIRKLLSLCLAWTIAMCMTGQSTDENYIIKRSYTDTLGHYTTTIRYFDGLGRPYRHVQKDAVAPGVDLVTATQYDSQGRDSVAWLPVKGHGGLPLTDAEVRTRAAAFYGNDSRPYRLDLYEPSALNRISRAFGPGREWAAADRATDTRYSLNSATEPRLMCRKYSVKNDTTLQKQGYYPAASLFVTETQDEDKHTLLVFKNSAGRTILERRFERENGPASDTYYVYDGHRLLCWVLPPAASDALGADGSWTTATEALDRFAYFYRYNGLQLAIEKKSPGAEKTEIIYDKADRVALLQDGNLRAQGKWQYFYYNAFGQPVVSGLCRLPAGSTPENYRQDISDRLYAKLVFDESAPGGYPQGNLPVVDAERVTVSYYDRYDFLGLPGFAGNNEYAASEYNAKGRITGSVSAVYGSADTIRTVYRYDRLGRLCETVSNNLVGGYDREKTTYTFTDQVQTKEKIHSSSALNTPLKEQYTYVYDEWGKLLSVDHRLNGETPMRLEANTYDALGRLSKKQLGDKAYATEYAYNIRGWQTATTGPLFSQQLYYQTGVNAPCYNGNIARMTWKASAETAWRGYTFSYDGLDRMTAAAYSEGASLASNPGRYTEKTTYDKMGNILSLQRYGKLASAGFGLIDQLSLSYTGNRLKKVSDATAAGAAAPGSMQFTDGADAVTEYTYDGNGNMIADLNRGISKVEYNLLNLPQRIVFTSGNSTSYLYGADGNKLRVTHKQGESVSTTEYISNMVYENGQLEKVLTDNGYITLTGSVPVYHYFLTDHLGNNRVVLKSDGTIEQVNHYYPFGGLFAEGTGADIQAWKYGGKELDRTSGLDWYDFTARMYDPILQAFRTMDPDAEKYYSTTPYHYCGNNPLNFADPTGKRRYRLNAASGSLTMEDDTEEDEDVIEVWKLKPMISQGSNFMDVKINLRPQYEKGESLTIPAGILPASQGDIKYEGFTAEGNLKDGLKVMNFISMNSNLELNAWAFSDEVGLEGLKVNSWFDSSFSSSAEEKPESIPGTKLYNVHTHPGNGNGIGGDGSPSKSDYSNKGLHPYIPHYIISRNQGLTETQLNRTYNVPRRSTTHPSLRKYIK